MESELKPINLLLIEDSEDDIVIIKKVFKKIGLINKLYVVRSGEEAFDFIYQQGKYAEEKLPTPGLILLDISLPVMSGFEVLNRIKEDSKYKKIPVVIFTTSSREEDIVKSYEGGACSYITKPLHFDDFVKIVKRFEIYWTLVSKIP